MLGLFYRRLVKPIQSLFESQRFLSSRHLFPRHAFITTFVVVCITINPFTASKSTAIERAAETAASTKSNGPAYLPYRIIDTQPHNPDSFIQGWVIVDGVFYESSGLYKKSFLQRYPNEPLNTDSSATAYLPKEYFAEGLTWVDGVLYVLTWREETLLLIDPQTLSIIDTKKYRGEGWGLTHNASHFIMSNGTDTLTFRNKSTFAVQRTLAVKYPKHFDQKPLHKPLLQLNELEYINGIVWANNWNNDTLYAINSDTGCIEGRVDLSQLRKDTVNPDNRNVLNGIAYDPKRQGIWVTGKYWPQRYLLTLPSTALFTALSTTHSSSLQASC